MSEAVEIVAGDGPSSYVLRIGGRDQSHVDLDDPTRLAFDYVRRMGDVVDALERPGLPIRVLHVGGAAMTLPRYVAATRPTSSQIVLEPAVEVTELVRAELPLPRRSGIKVRPVDGRAGTAALRDDSVDLVLLDAYAEGVVPPELLTRAWFRDVDRVLAPDGTLALNLSDRAPFQHSRRVVAGLRQVFAEVMLSAEPATLRGRRAGNLLVVVSRGRVPVEELRRSAASSPSPYRVLDAAQVSDSFGGGTPLHEAEAGEAT